MALCARQLRESGLDWSVRKVDLSLRCLLCVRSEGFLRHGRALKHGWANSRGGFWPPRRWPTTFRRPHPVIPRQVAPQQSLLLFHWTKSKRFPFPFPLGSYRQGNGKRQFELIAFAISDHLAFGGQFCQGSANGSGAD